MQTIIVCFLHFKNCFWSCKLLQNSIRPNPVPVFYMLTSSEYDSGYW